MSSPPTQNQNSDSSRRQTPPPNYADYLLDAPYIPTIPLPDTEETEPRPPTPRPLNVPLPFLDDADQIQLPPIPFRLEFDDGLEEIDALLIQQYAITQELLGRLEERRIIIPEANEDDLRLILEAIQRIEDVEEVLNLADPDRLLRGPEDLVRDHNLRELRDFTAAFLSDRAPSPTSSESSFSSTNASAGSTSATSVTTLVDTPTPQHTIRAPLVQHQDQPLERPSTSERTRPLWQNIDSFLKYGHVKTLSAHLSGEFFNDVDGYSAWLSYLNSTYRAVPPTELRRTTIRHHPSSRGVHLEPRRNDIYCVCSCCGRDHCPTHTFDSYNIPKENYG